VLGGPIPRDTVAPESLAARPVVVIDSYRNGDSPSYNAAVQNPVRREEIAIRNLAADNLTAGDDHQAYARRRRRRCWCPKSIHATTLRGHDLVNATPQARNLKLAASICHGLGYLVTILEQHDRRFSDGSTFRVDDPTRELAASA